MRRPLLIAILLGIASTALPDRLITIPLGRKITFDTFKIDGFAELSNLGTWDRFVGFGISPEFEVDYHGERIDSGPTRDTLDLSYNYVTPIMNQSPGISVGVQDALNRMRGGRRFYVAATWRQAVDTIGTGNLPLEATLGVSQGSRTLPLVGVSLPFSQDLRLLAEDDGVRIASGIEFRLFKNALGVRLIVRDQDVMVGANLTLRF
ncbi:MAG: hypothetical protein ACHQ50_04165 [Fimbriimonadales bacterium]